MRGCGSNFFRMIIGYTSPYSDEAQSTEKIKAMDHVALTKVDLKGVDMLQDEL